jgi:hypothetical protein
MQNPFVYREMFCGCIGFETRPLYSAKWYSVIDLTSVVFEYEIETKEKSVTRNGALAYYMWPEIVFKMAKINVVM